MLRQWNIGCNNIITVKFLNFRNFCCNLPRIQTKMQNLRVFCQNDANGIANSEDPDQTAPPLSDCSSRSSLIWVCTVCQDLSVRKLRVITVCFSGQCFSFSFNKICLH